ncbi:uncharacterized protein LOC135813020 [Sycon ciliatum]|uniref:uncharacterized protein LOC135813020 n=1 Tax=Sycon ciliatum TaxID=27933 RepID=UPI0031F6603F
MDWPFLVLCTVLALVFYFWNSLSNAFVLWTVAFGGADGRRDVACSSRMHAYIARSELLDEVSFAELFQLCREIVDSEPNVGIEALQDVVLSYKFVSMYRDRVDGSLRGMLLLDERDRTHHGRDIIVFRLGLALFKQQYQGGALPYIFFLYRALRCFLLQPNRQVYVLVKLFSYKSYMIAMNSSEHAYPRYDTKTPEFEQSLIDEYGYSLETSMAKYDPETCVVTRSHVRLERHAAPIRDSDLQNPHIQHFVKLNPGWQKGHCLVACAKITPGVFLSIAKNSLMRAIFHRSRHAGGKPRPRLSRQTSLADALNRRRLYTSNIGDPSSFIVTSSNESASPGEDGMAVDDLDTIDMEDAFS